jgi:hypothetical protein
VEDAIVARMKAAGVDAVASHSALQTKRIPSRSSSTPFASRVPMP